jgi:hypothetical protein
VTDLERQALYGPWPTEVTWRPITAIALAEADGNPDTRPIPTGCR